MLLGCTWVPPMRVDLSSLLVHCGQTRSNWFSVIRRNFVDSVGWQPLWLQLIMLIWTEVVVLTSGRVSRQEQREGSH